MHWRSLRAARSNCGIVVNLSHSLRKHSGLGWLNFCPRYWASSCSIWRQRAFGACPFLSNTYCSRVKTPRWFDVKRVKEEAGVARLFVSQIRYFKCFREDPDRQKALFELWCMKSFNFEPFAEGERECAFSNGDWRSWGYSDLLLFPFSSSSRTLSGYGRGRGFHLSWWRKCQSFGMRDVELCYNTWWQPRVQDKRPWTSDR